MFKHGRALWGCVDSLMDEKYTQTRADWPLSKVLPCFFFLQIMTTPVIALLSADIPTCGGRGLDVVDWWSRLLLTPSQAQTPGRSLTLIHTGDSDAMADTVATAVVRDTYFITAE